MRARTSAASAVLVKQAGSLATAYQVASHDGHRGGGALDVGSLAEKWSVTLGTFVAINGDGQLTAFAPGTGQ